MTTKETMNPNKTARVVGILFLIMLLAGPFSLVYVPSQIIVPGDAAATVNNLMDSNSLFRASNIGHLIVLFADLGVSVLLYLLLKPVNKTLALFAAAFRLVMVAMRGINLTSQLLALLLLSGADYLSVFEPDQLHALVLLFLNAFESGILIDQAFFGPHLLIVGYLVFKSGFLPRVLGVLSIIAGFGYLIDSVTFILLPDFDATISQFTFIGEIILMLWLLTIGVNVEKWEDRVFESA